MNIPLHPGILVLLALMGLQAQAAEPDSTSAEPDTTEAATLTEYANGLQLLVLPEPDETLVQVDVYLSLRGAALNAGMAHLVEHLMFTSTEHCPRGSVRDSLQLVTTFSNAYTSARNVHTRNRCLPELLPRVLRVDAERFGRLKPDEEDLEQERKRILGEQDFRKEGGGSTWQALAHRIISMAYQEDVEAGDPIGGSPDVIGAVGLAEVDTFVTRWMRPDRTVVMISGPVEPDSVEVLVAKTFGTLAGDATEKEIGELPPPPKARSFVTRSEDRSDLLEVGFRLPYGTPEEAAIAHLTETIMDREDGNPNLILFEDEALLILSVWADWSYTVTDSAGASRAIEQFWKETRTVIRRVGDDWLFNRNRAAHVEGFTERLKQPYRRTTWRAQRLADGRDLPAPEILAAMVDTLSAERIQAFFAENITRDKAFTAFAAGRAPANHSHSDWNRGLRFRTNPYLVPLVGSMDLGVEDIAPVLETAASGAIGETETIVLSNGIPVHLLPLTHSTWVYLGGVRTYPSLEDEAPSQDPGRLRVYRSLVNWGYDRKGSNIQPRGERPGYSTRIDSRVNSFRITAKGRASKFDNVAAAMHKRINVANLKPYSFEWLVDHRRDRYGKPYEIAPVIAHAWRREQVFGADAPQVGWYRPDLESIEKWSLGKANKLHKELCQTGNLQMVAAGRVDSITVKSNLDEDFGDRPKPEPGWYPVLARPGLGIEGAVVHDQTSEVGTLQILFPPRPLSDEPALEPVDLMVLAQLMESRLRVASGKADLDSVSIFAWVDPAGASGLPQIQAISRPKDSATVLAMVQQELEELASAPPTMDEEARARLQVVGPLIEDLLDGEDGRNLLLEIGQFGAIPGDILGQLHERGYGEITSPDNSIFPSDRFAWTVLVDTSLINLPDFGTPQAGDPETALIEYESR